MVDLTNRKRTENTTTATSSTAGGGGHVAAAVGTKPPKFSPFHNVFSTPSPSASPNPAPSAASVPASTRPPISTAMLSLNDVAGKLIVVRKESIGHLLVGQDLRSYKRINGNANDKIRMKFTIPNPSPNPNPNPSPSLNPNPNRVDTAKGEAMHARDATRGAAHGLARVGRAVEGQVEEGRQRVGRVVQTGQVRARVRVVLLDAPDRDTRLVRARRELRARLRTGLRARRGRTVSSTLMTLAMVKMAGPQLLS